MSKNVMALADHLVGNLYYNLDNVAMLASQLPPEAMRYAVGGPAAVVYSEMCRQLSTANGLSAGSLEAGLASQNFNFDWLAQLQNRVLVEKPATLVNYAGEIINQHDLMKLQLYSKEAIAAAAQEGAQASTVTGELLTKLTAGSAVTKGVEHASTIMERVRKQLAVVRAGGTWGASTGFPCLDRIFRLVDGELIVIAGRPSQGKTALARQMFYYRALALANAGQRGQVIFFSADDTSDKFMMDLACTVAKLDSNLFKGGALIDGKVVKATGDQWAELEHAMMIIESLPIYIDDTPKPTVEHMYYKCAMLNAVQPVVLAGMDYAGLCSVPEAHSERQQAEMAFSGMKGIGNTLRFPFVVLSQLTKSVETRANKFPTPSDLMYGGEAESNVCLTIVRPEHYVDRGEEIDVPDAWKKNVAIITIGKNKSGSIGMRPMYFDKRTTFFDALEIKTTSLEY